MVRTEPSFLRAGHSSRDSQSTLDQRTFGESSPSLQNTKRVVSTSLFTDLVLLWVAKKVISVLLSPMSSVELTHGVPSAMELVETGSTLSKF